MDLSDKGKSWEDLAHEFISLLPSLLNASDTLSVRMSIIDTHSMLKEIIGGYLLERGTKVYKSENEIISFRNLVKQFSISQPRICDANLKEHLLRYNDIRNKVAHRKFSPSLEDNDTFVLITKNIVTALIQKKNHQDACTIDTRRYYDFDRQLATVDSDDTDADIFIGHDEYSEELVIFAVEKLNMEYEEAIIWAENWKNEIFYSGISEFISKYRKLHKFAVIHLLYNNEKARDWAELWIERLAARDVILFLKEFRKLQIYAINKLNLSSLEAVNWAERQILRKY